MELDSSTYSAEQRRDRDTYRIEMQTAQKSEWTRAVMDNLERAEEQCMGLKLAYRKKEISQKEYCEMLNFVAVGVRNRHEMLIEKCDSSDAKKLDAQYKMLSDYFKTELKRESVSKKKNQSNSEMEL